MSIEFILAQVVILIAALFYALTYFTKNRALILIYRILNAGCYIIAYFLLATVSAALANIVATSRIVIFFLYARKDKACPLWMFIILQVAIVVVSAIFWTGPITLILIAAHLLDGYSVWIKDIKLYRWVSIPVSILFGTFNLLCGAYTAVIIEAIVLVVKIVSIVEYYTSERKNKQMQA